MSMAGYSSRGSSYLSDDIDDEEFLRRPKNSSGFNMNGNDPRFSNASLSLEEQRQKILQEMREIEESSIRSTERSLNQLRNTEELGAATAEELYRQREQLERTEKRLDDINTTLRFSERHIQGIKSVFGGLKNLLSGKTKGLPPSGGKSPEDAAAAGSVTDFQVIDRSTSQKKILDNAPLHPGLKIRGLYEEEESPDVRAQDVIDRNLEQMLGSIHRLKDLSQNLGNEIESQNDLIDNVLYKTEKADISIHKQNKDIQKILKK